MRDMGRKPWMLRCAPVHAVSRRTPSPGGAPYDAPNAATLAIRTASFMEVFLLLWDEMDDWVNAAAHLLRGLAGRA